MQLGASFSHRHLQYLQIDPMDALCAFRSLNLPWVRLSCYWDEIEREQGTFSFETIDPLVAYCEKQGINIVMTIGMKAMRYPEFYFPEWLKKNITYRTLSKIKKDDALLLNSTLKFLNETIHHFKQSRSIKIWQIENEPLDFAGKKWWTIDEKFLEEEVGLVKSHDTNRNIMISLWGNEIGKRSTYKSATKLSDIVGLDIYLKYAFPVLWRFKKYIGPLDSQKTIMKIGNKIKDANKKLWIAELQTEPWEPQEIVTKKENPPSFMPHDFEKNMQYILPLKPEVVMLWGFEYWYYRLKKGDARYWQEAERIIKQYAS